jgi:hypothetical protein
VGGAQHGDRHEDSRSAAATTWIAAGRYRGPWCHSPGNEGKLHEGTLPVPVNDVTVTPVPDGDRLVLETAMRAFFAVTLVAVRNAVLEPLAFSSTAWPEPAQELSAAWMRAVSGGVVSWAAVKARVLR